MLQAISFLTVFGRAGAPTPRALYFFPPVGALIGLVVGGAWWAAGLLWPPLVAAAIAVTVDAALTGLLHLDGLSDAADGLLSPMDRDRRLAVMRDPAVGAFGAVALIVVLVLRFSAFAAVPSGWPAAVPSGAASGVPAAPLAIAALWCVSRTAMAVIALSLRYARQGGGLASAFVGSGHGAARSWCMLIGVLIAVPLAVLADGWRGLLVPACAVAGSVIVAWFARVRIGGFTGDVLGAAGVVGETAGLLCLAAL